MNIINLQQYIPPEVLGQVPGVMLRYDLSSSLRLAHFLSQCAHESWGFKAVRENMNYNKAGLLKVFKKYFPTEELAAQYSRKPELIANRVYGNRMGNGPEASGDGWRHRGRAYIQITGKINYAAFDKVVPEDILANPDLIATKYALLSAGWYWNSRNLNALADQGSTIEVIKAITKKINGGYNGLEDRIRLFNIYYPVLR